MSDQTPAERVARYLSAREQVRGTDPEEIHALYTSFSEVARLEHSDLSALLAQREALLEALIQTESALGNMSFAVVEAARNKARAAIALATKGEVS